MIIFFLLFVLSVLSQVITYDKIEPKPTINFINQNLDVLNNHKIFIEAQAIVLIEIKYCLPPSIQYLLGNLTLFYRDIDTKHVTEGFLFTKLSKDLQNHKPFCSAIKDSANVFVKRMSYLLNLKYFRPDVSKELKKKVHSYNIHQRCLETSFDLGDKYELFKCLKDTERKALFNALRQ